jgi:hypothetical protein
MVRQQLDPSLSRGEDEHGVGVALPKRQNMGYVAAVTTIFMILYNLSMGYLITTAP